MVLSIIFCLSVLAFGSPVARAAVVAYLVYCGVSKQAALTRYECISTWFPDLHNKIRRFYGHRYIAETFPISLVKTADLTPEPHLFCCHPHGVISTGAAYALVYDSANWSTIFPGIPNPIMMTLKIVMCVPFVREFMLLINAGTCDKSCVEYTLKQGKSPLLVPGGAEESLLVPYDNQVPIVLKTRKGFVRIAMQQKAPLVPVYSFGEHDLYTQYTSGVIRRIASAVKAVTGFSPLVFSGAFPFILLPKRRRMKVVVGAPIRTDDFEGELTEELVIKKHEEYKEALMHLFEEHREDFYPPEFKLVFV